MPLLPDLPRIQNAVELLDGPASLSELEANFRDISRLNPRFCGSWETAPPPAPPEGGRRGGTPMGTYGAIVVGAGPAGSAFAVLLAEHGRSVLLLDKAAFPRPKICGEYLSPEASRILDRLAVLKTVDAAGGGGPPGARG